MANHDQSDVNAPVKLASFASEMEANMLKHELRRQGIEAHTLGGSISGFKAEAPSEVVVVVTAAQFDQAERVRDELSLATEIDWSKVDVGDPTDDTDGDVVNPD